ncbi:MAG: type IV toxin-antitoxin system AbiEi family antitoxin domain-containing protein [Oscillospiraceae bacterium]
MKLNSEIFEAIKLNNSTISTAKVLELGYSKTMLTKYVNAGLLERIGRGIYALPDTIVDDMYVFMLRSEKIIFSHDTALFLNGLSNRTPFLHSVTIPNNATLSKAMSDECVCYYVKSELHELGLTMRNTTFGNRVRCYNIERTICDLLRSRKRCDDETVIDAIKNYAAAEKKDLNRLASYANTFKVAKELRKYMEVLL